MPTAATMIQPRRPMRFGPSSVTGAVFAGSRMPRPAAISATTNTIAPPARRAKAMNAGLKLA